MVVPKEPTNANCAICDEPVNVSRAGFCREETGWSEVRDQGGTHALMQRQTTGRVAHMACVKHGPMNRLL